MSPQVASCTEARAEQRFVVAILQLATLNSCALRQTQAINYRLRRRFCLRLLCGCAADLRARIATQRRPKQLTSLESISAPSRYAPRMSLCEHANKESKFGATKSDESARSREQQKAADGESQFGAQKSLSASRERGLRAAKSASFCACFCFRCSVFVLALAFSVCFASSLLGFALICTDSRAQDSQRTSINSASFEWRLACAALVQLAPRLAQSAAD